MSRLVADQDSYGIFGADAVQNPYPHYRAMREREPIHWSERAQAWYFTRYRDVFDLQDRPDLSVDRIETLYSYLPRINPERFSDIVEHYHRWLLYRDDAYHDRLKALFLKAMTPRAVERLRRPAPNSGNARSAGFARFRRGDVATLERPLFQFPVPAGFAR
jgi:cytochrome P450